MAQAPTRPTPVRCAIYTRKSTSENLDMDFNTLDAQREAAELYIRSQASQGWVVLPDRYDDGGFTGGNMDRPGLQRLIDDIEAGKVDCVVVYKVDRLSRSLLDFAKLIEVFDQKGIGFVSTTQQFNTSTSLGRLVLNILLSFAQFEREMISERTRDKMGAARRKGKWVGGPPVLGYAVDRERRRLVVVPDEAEQARAIFQLYLRLRSIGGVTDKLRALGWRKKAYLTKDGRQSGGKPWDSNTVHRMLRNPVYVGKVRYKGEIYEGEHEAIIADEVFDRVQQILDAKSCGRGPRRNRNPDYLLAGLLYCRCGDAMTTSSARGRKGREYRYYLCHTRQVSGPDACDHPRIPSGEIEQVILDRVQELCRNEAVRQGVTERLDQGKTEVGQGLAAERAQVQARIDVLTREARDLLALFKHGEGGAGARVVSERLGELETEIDTLRTRTGELDDQIRGLSEAVGRVNTALDLLDSFDELWDALVPEERLELLRLLIERIDIDEPAGKLQIAFHDLAAPFPALAPPPDDDPPASPEPVVAALMEGFAP